MVLRNNWYYLLLVFLTISCENKESKFNISQVFRYNEHKNIGSLDPAFAKDNADIKQKRNVIFKVFIVVDFCGGTQ